MHNAHKLSNLPPAILLMGPTASGKSRLALKIAKYFPVEIISVDSAQVYRHMDIGTAKPDAATLTATPHHLIDIIEPYERYSAAQFRDDTLNIMHAISQRGKIPLLTGGTLLYFRALLQGLSELPPANEKLRAKIEATAKDLGWSAMHQTLHQLDPESAARIQPNDRQRIQRALEICHLADKPMSALINQPRDNDFPYHAIKIALLPSDRSVLHQSISQRFDKMIASGLIEEVRELRVKFNLDSDMPAMRCVGYRQVWMYLDNAIDRTKMAEMGTAATRQLAKRQLTWLRGMRNETLKEFDCLDKDLTNQVLTYLQNSCLPLTLQFAQGKLN